MLAFSCEDTDLLAAVSSSSVCKIRFCCLLQGWREAASGEARVGEESNEGSNKDEEHAEEDENDDDEDDEEKGGNKDVGREEHDDGKDEEGDDDKTSFFFCFPSFALINTSFLLLWVETTCCLARGKSSLNF